LNSDKSLNRSGERNELLTHRIASAKVLAMTIDSNIWGWLALPVGLLLCFAPPMVLWLTAELRGDQPEE
jgi:hypothetical protein